ncbi:MAG: rRNA pseudouridine synthase [Lachnospiraceae bacterium]|nr:rRNA pseudouridine synthase [Lachnospiraceae bacterium]
MIRLDKYLCEVNIGTRSEVKELIRKGRITVNGDVCKSPDRKINESETVCLDGQTVSYAVFHYLMFHKPAGVLTAARDKKQPTVMDYFRDYPGRDLNPVGRLDKDTTGLLLITNDGALSHMLLSPKKHVPKTYEVHLRDPIDPDACKKLEEGVDISEAEPEPVTAPAKVTVIEDRLIHLTITEGRFHQVKRMLCAVGNEVTGLKRLSMGSLILDEALQEGEYRPLTGEEEALLLTYRNSQQ